METIIPCRNCDHPLKSGSCLGCNVFRLYEALQRGKLDWAKDEHNGIVEGKLEQPTLSPDDMRGVGKWLRKEKLRHNLDGDGDYRYECSACGHSDEHNENVHVPFCWYCGAKMEVSEDA